MAGAAVGLGVGCGEDDGAADWTGAAVKVAVGDAEAGGAEAGGEAVSAQTWQETVRRIHINVRETSFFISGLTPSVGIRYIRS